MGNTGLLQYGLGKGVFVREKKGGEAFWGTIEVISALKCGNSPEKQNAAAAIFIYVALHRQAEGNTNLLRYGLVKVVFVRKKKKRRHSGQYRGDFGPKCCTSPDKTKRRSGEFYQRRSTPPS